MYILQSNKNVDVTKSWTRAFRDPDKWDLMSCWAMDYDTKVLYEPLILKISKDAKN